MPRRRGVAVNRLGPARSRVGRALVRAPIVLYRWHLGVLLGGRFVLLTHTGRTSGRARQVVLEVVGRGDGPGTYLVASGYGSGAHWYRNIVADPTVRFQVGRHEHRGTARPLPAAESGRRLAHYADRHPRTAAALMRMTGHHAGEDYHEIGADPERGVPLVELRPDHSRDW